MAVRRIEVRERVMERNNTIAANVRDRLRRHGITTYNLVSSPGAGKTLLLERTLRDLGAELDISVITGDVQTQNDADRLARHTSRLVQAVVTGGACHLDARQIEAGLDSVDLDATRLLIIENVGNLVCPANWDLGETAKLVVFSVTEGEDKPLKYPRMFERSTHVIFNKIDLLRHVPFDVDRAVAYARQVNSSLGFMSVSALHGTGMHEWYQFLRTSVRELQPH